jgi:hypothetical protein
MHRKKEEVILRILAQESVDLELWLKRYEFLKFWSYFCGFFEARDLFVNIFQISGPNYKITDGGLISEKQRGLSTKSAKTRPQVDFKETQGLLCKIPRNIDVTNYFPTVKAWTGSTRGEPVGRAWSTVDRLQRGPRVPERGGVLTGVRPPAALVHQSSPTGAQKREGSTRSSVRASPEVGRWQCRIRGGDALWKRCSSVERSEERLGEVR